MATTYDDRGVLGGQGMHRALTLVMTPQELRDRSDRFADNIVAFCRRLPKDPLAQRLALQLQDSGTSVAANYHAACRARSRAAFVAKLSIVVEEADETLAWLKRVANAELASGPALEALLKECDELVAIFVASRRTASGPRRNSTDQKG